MATEAEWLKLPKLAHAIYRVFLALKTENFQLKMFDIFLIIAQNIDCGYMLEPRRGGSNILTSTHNLCFEAKIRKIGIPLQTPDFLYKSGVQGGYTFHGHVFLMKLLSIILSSDQSVQCELKPYMQHLSY